MPKTKAKLKAKCDRLASAYYRAKTPYCELAGLDGNECGGMLNWAHIFTRSILHMRYTPYNNLILCQGHHLWYTTHPIEWVRILEKHFPDKLAIAETNRYRIDKVDYEYWIDFFMKGRDDTHTRELQELCQGDDREVGG